MTLSRSPSATSIVPSPKKQASTIWGTLTTLLANPSNRCDIRQEHNEDQQEQEQEQSRASIATLPFESSSYSLESTQMSPELYPTEPKSQQQLVEPFVPPVPQSAATSTAVAPRPTTTLTATTQPAETSTTTAAAAGSAQISTDVPQPATTLTSIAERASLAPPRSLASSSKVTTSAIASASALQRHIPSRAGGPPIRRTGRSPGKQMRPARSPAPSPDPSTYPPLPPVKVKDYAGQPIPPLIELPVDPDWVVDALPGRVRGLAPVEGVFQRHTENWEARHEYTLYRTGMNRAYPPGTKYKMWGGLSEEEDNKKWKETFEPVPLSTQRTEEDLEKGMFIINEEKKKQEKADSNAEDDDEKTEREAREAKWREAREKARRWTHPSVLPPPRSVPVLSTMPPRGGTFIEPMFVLPSRLEVEPSVEPGDDAEPQAGPLNNATSSFAYDHPLPPPKRKLDDTCSGAGADVDKRRRYSLRSRTATQVRLPLSPKTKKRKGTDDEKEKEA